MGFLQARKDTRAKIKHKKIKLNNGKSYIGAYDKDKEIIKTESGVFDVKTNI